MFVPFFENTNFQIGVFYSVKKLEKLGTIPILHVFFTFLIFENIKQF